MLTGQKKQYSFKAPDELLLLTEKIMAKIANSLLGKEVNHQIKPQKDSDALVFNDLHVLHLYYQYDNKFGKIAIELQENFVANLLKVLMKKGGTEESTLINFATIFTSVFQNLLIEVSQYESN